LAATLAPRPSPVTRMDPARRYRAGSTRTATALMRPPPINVATTARATATAPATRWRPATNAPPPCAAAAASTAASNCTGTGACAIVTPLPCGAFQCSITGGCKTSCAAQADCGSGSYCNTTTGSCLVKLAPGAACSAGVACPTGNCVDGVCCEKRLHRDLPKPALPRRPDRATACVARSRPEPTPTANALKTRPTPAASTEPATESAPAGTR